MSTTFKGKITLPLLSEQWWKYPVCHFSSLWSVNTYHTSTARRWLRNQKWYYILHYLKNHYCVIPGNIHTPSTEGIGNSRGGGVLKTPKFKATYVAKWEFPWGGGLDIHWNYT